MTSRVSPHSEHHIHASLLAHYPSIHSVIHAHTPHLTAFACPGVPPLRACAHTAAFLGDSIPVFDIGNRYPKTGIAGGAAGYLGGLLGSSGSTSGGAVVDRNHPHNMLVNTKGLGDALAAAFALPPTASAAALDMARSLTLSASSSSGGGSDKKEGKKVPDYAVVLQRGHGFVTWGASVEDAVYRAVYALENAKVQMMAMQAQASVRGRSNGERGERLEVGFEDFGGWLRPDEMRDAAATVNEGAVKAWPSWVREVRRGGGYENELDGLLGGKR